MADELDEEERALIEKHRAARAKDNFEVEIGDDKGNRARLPYHKGRSWLQKTFGIDLDEEKPGDEKDKGKAGDAKGEGEVKRFVGRRVS